MRYRKGLTALRGRTVNVPSAQCSFRSRSNHRYSTEHRVSFLFDWLLYQAVLGYESALTNAFREQARGDELEE
jgi:hypothetical protein